MNPPPEKTTLKKPSLIKVNPTIKIWFKLKFSKGAIIKSWSNELTLSFAQQIKGLVSIWSGSPSWKS